MPIQFVFETRVRNHRSDVRFVVLAVNDLWAKTKPIDSIVHGGPVSRFWIAAHSFSPNHFHLYPDLTIGRVLMVRISGYGLPIKFLARREFLSEILIDLIDS